MAVENDVIEEVRRLSNRFGIGLIKLDPENIEQGEILVPARFNKHLDFDAMDRLAAENPDFRIFLQNIIDDNKITNVKSKYDDILDDDKYQQYIKEKKIIN
jgi:uncharacterized protein